MPRRRGKENTPDSISAPPPDIQGVPENVWIQKIAEQNETAETLKASMYDMVGESGEEKQIFNSFAKMVNFNNYIRDQESAFEDYDKYKSYWKTNTQFKKSVQYIQKLLRQRNVHFDLEHIQEIVFDNPITFSNIEDFFRFCEKLVLPEEEEKKMIKVIDDSIKETQKMQRDMQKQMNEVTKARIKANDMRSEGRSLIDDDSEFPNLGTESTSAWNSVKSTQRNKKPLRSRNMQINIQQSLPSASQDFQKLLNKQKFERKFREQLRKLGVDDVDDQTTWRVYSNIPENEQQDTSEEAMQHAIQNYFHLIAGNSSVYMPSHGYAAAAPACHALTYAAPVAYAGPHAMAYAAMAYDPAHAMAYAAPVQYGDAHAITYAAPVQHGGACAGLADEKRGLFQHRSIPGLSIYFSNGVVVVNYLNTPIHRSKSQGGIWLLIHIQKNATCKFEIESGSMEPYLPDIQYENLKMHFVVALARWYENLSEDEKSLVSRHCISDISLKNKLVKEMCRPLLMHSKSEIMDQEVALKTKPELVLCHTRNTIIKLTFSHDASVDIHYNDKTIGISEGQLTVVFDATSRLQPPFFYVTQEQMTDNRDEYPLGKRTLFETSWPDIQRIADTYNKLSNEHKKLVQLILHTRTPTNKQIQQAFHVWTGNALGLGV